MKTLTLLLSLFAAAVQCSQLAEAVTAMRAKSFRAIINATGLETGMFRTGPLNEPIFPFANDAAWDPVNEKILFIGAAHQSPWVWGFPIYDVATNNWRKGNQGPYFDPVDQIRTHSYDNITSVYGTGKMYFYTPTPTTHPQRSTYSYCMNIYDVPTDTWDIELVPNNMVSGPYSALNYFPDKNGLVYTNGGVISFYDLGTKAWRILGNRAMGGISNVGEYDPVHHVMLVGGGGDSRQLYKIDTAWNITPIALCPVILDVASMILTCDPVTGTFIVWSAADSLYGYDVETDQWSAVVKSPIANFNAAWAVATPVREYGVIVFLTNYSWPILIYKHAESPQAVETGAKVLKTGSIVSCSPNPFRTGLAISALKPCVISVYDLPGRRLASFQAVPGKTMVWQPEGLPAGTYLVKAAAQGMTDLKTIVLLK